MTATKTKPAKDVSTPNHRAPASPSDPTRHHTMPAGEPSDLDYTLALIRHLGRTLDDLEKLRIQHQLRRMAFERDTGTPLPPDPVLDQLESAEHQAELELKRLWRKHPLAPWAKTIRGVGEKSIARLIAEIGDPAARQTVSQLWAYCGYDPTRRRRKGMSQEEAVACGNPHAKKQCWLIATSMLKTGNRDVYDQRRAHTAASNTDWTPGHSHNDALRITAKEFLKDLWIASRQGTTEAQ